MSAEFETLLKNYDRYLKDADLYEEFEPIKEFGHRFQETMMVYSAAIREVRTKLEVLNDEFQIRSRRNPIRYINHRIKRPESIVEKMHRRGFEISLDSMINNLNDIAGIRVVCGYASDIYDIADMLKKQDDVEVLIEKDYLRIRRRTAIEACIWLWRFLYFSQTANSLSRLKYRFVRWRWISGPALNISFIIRSRGMWMKMRLCAN